MDKTIVCLLILGCLVGISHCGQPGRPGVMMPGGVSEESPATAEDQELANKVKDAVERAEERTFEKFEAKTVRTQVVNGWFHYVKVDVGNGEFIHVKIHQHWNGKISLQSYRAGKTSDDPLESFY
ncbi:unnamed protein product [Owenia fusiformis]|uniref:Uncharacterized protein n=1 Tax=Owenia fusiformis TaxID=6347 RepID=A0A8J1Y669_OWEFU|nr:unnamed protein product [Owenia fusiformis]